MRLAAAAILLMTVTTPSLANVQVRFDEGAPKDRFTITNTGSCALGAMVLSIDLSGSPYGLIFDTTRTGAGVDVFQPFELTAGKANLAALPLVQDGDNKITFDLKGLKASETISFTIDVDDTANAREITVSNTEMAGAKIVAETDSGMVEAQFQDNAVAKLPPLGCVS